MGFCRSAGILATGYTIGMSAITGIFKVNADGNVVVPVGSERAGLEVEVSVNPLEESQLLDRLSDDEWRRCVADTAGAISDPTFLRHDQGRFEDRLEFE
jgi:hypothetical protein